MRPPIVAGAIVLATALAVGNRSAFAQEPPQDDRERPVIGLVLSGGGARGGAHLGVLKALEELRVPIDVIAGTSIGAAIGGLYASGMTIAELEEFVYGIDWDAAFLNSTPRRLQSFRRKREDDLFLLEMSPGFDEEGLSLPTGVVQGQVIDTVMARVTLPVAAVDDFDALAIPFRAVASDLETGEAVVLGRGNLARAIRASMSVPAVLAPMDLGGRSLVDGGIVMNLPVEVAQAMGAERIIAVDISEKLSTRDELNSVVDVITQLTSMLTVRGTTDQIARLANEDILLVPVFEEGYSSVSFGKLAETIGTGYDLVIDNPEVFAPYRLSEAEYSAYRAALPNPRTTAQPTIDFVRPGDTAPLAPSVIEARVGDIELGEPLDLDAVETVLNRVHGLGSYRNVRYALVEEDGRQGIALELVDRGSNGSSDGDADGHSVTQYGQLGLRYSSSSDQDTLFGLAVGYLRPDINPLGGEWRAILQLGDEPRFFADLYQPLGPKALNFFNPALDVSSTQLNVFVERELAAELKLRSAVLELGGGHEFLDWAEIRGGFRVGAGDTKLRVGDPSAVPYDSFHRGELFARFSVDTLDNISIPREGNFATAEWLGSSTSMLGADHDYDQLLVDVVHAKTWGRNTLLANLRWDSTISGQAPAYALFRLGGFRDLSGLSNGEITGQHATRLGASYYRRIGDLALFPAFVGFSAEVGNVWERRSDISLGDAIWGGAIWVGVDTPAGPVFLAYGSAEGGRDAFYASLGRLF